MRKSSKELKQLASEQMLGHYGLLINGYIFVALLSYLLDVMLYGISNEGFVWQLASSLIEAIITSIFVAGFFKMCMRISRGEDASRTDLFFAIKNDPDKVVVISAVFWFVRNLPMLIRGLVENSISENFDVVTKNYVVWGLFIVLEVICLLVLLFLMICYPVYIDNPNFSAVNVISHSYALMNQNKKRFIGLLISFIPMALLAIVTLGIGCLLIYPYGIMILINFYEDVKGEGNGYYCEA